MASDGILLSEQTKVHDECKECGWGSDREFDTPAEALSALTGHVGHTSDCDITWREYLLKYNVHECAGCGRPLDRTSLDRCYDCRLEHQGFGNVLSDRDA